MYDDKGDPRVPARDHSLYYAARDEEFAYSESKYTHPARFTTAKGWSGPLFWLVLHSLVAVLWGAALAVFITIKVPLHWKISQLGQKYPQYTNSMVSFIATLSTLHIRYVLQRVVELYTQELVVSGFKLSDLQWLQGVRELSIFAQFPRGSYLKSWPFKRVFWVVSYVGLILHTSSLVAILQPKPYFQHVYFGDLIPCAVPQSDLTLQPDILLGDDQQRDLDSLSFRIGMEVTNYGGQMLGNTTTSAAGRAYTKDPYAYGVIGGLINGLQELPGVQYSAQCSDDHTEADGIWGSIFPDQPFPKLGNAGAADLFNFTYTPAPAPFGTVATKTGIPFSITETEAWMYAMVDPTGSGALVSLAVDYKVDRITALVCGWRTLPKIIHAQTLNFSARSLSADDAPDSYPSLAGRSTLMTLNGMAQAVGITGGGLQASVYNPGTTYFGLTPEPSAAQVLETLLADGGKASLTAYNSIFWNKRGPGLDSCTTNNRTVQEHWRFGNTNNLGWIATVWSIGFGFIGLTMAIWLSRRRRLPQLRVLDVSQAFALGKGDITSDDMVLRVDRGSIVEGKNHTHM